MPPPPASDPDAAPGRRAWHWLAGAAVALFGALASYGVWQHQIESTQALAQSRFERQADALAELLQQRLTAKIDLLLGLRGLLLVKPDLSRSDFERVAGSLQLDVEHASVRNLHFTRYVPAAERSAFEARARANAHLDGRLPAGFSIHPEVEQPEYFVVDYVWPVQGNEEAQGLEIHSQPVNLEAMLRARGTGALTASGPFALAQQHGVRGAAINLRLPIFVGAGEGRPPRFLGAVGAVVSVDTLMQGLSRRGYLDGLVLSVHDLGMAPSGMPPGQQLFASGVLPPQGKHLTRDLTVGGRLWRLALAPGQSFMSESEARQPLLSLLFALALTALLAVLVARLVMRRMEALDYARLAASAARESEARFHTVFNQAAVGMLQTDTVTGELLHVNQRFCELTGYDADELRGMHIQDLTYPDDAPRSRALQEQLTSGELTEFRVEKRYRHKNGGVIWVDVTGSVIRAAPGARRYNISVVQDITRRRETEQELRYLAYNDPLTGLPNRRLLLDRLEQALAMSVRHQTWGAVLLLDLDHFKTLNELRGHEAGDRLLRQVAERLRACIGADTTVARQGGDEFVIVLKDLGAAMEDAATHGEETARRVLTTLQEPFDLQSGEPYHTSLSIGITVYDGNGEPADELLKRSELAMYEAKNAGRNTLRFYDPRMQAVVAARAQLEADMRAGLAEGQFELYYQPKVAHGSIQGAEALLRWRHPERGFVPPSEFIALAEDCGLILQLGQWVLQSACKQLAQWSGDEQLGALSVAVNVSPRQFHEGRFVAEVLQAIAGSGADARRLRLELTEGMLLQDVEDTIAKMVKLRGYGVGFSLDDFGTGYSSLAYLKRLPLHELKIDQSFVRDVLTDPNDAAIARTIVALGTSLGLQVTAEGVETEAQRAFLEKSGCHVWQGYLLAPPLPRERFEALVRERAAPAT